jgi:hypothetical protein
VTKPRLVGAAPVLLLLLAPLLLASGSGHVYRNEALNVRSFEPPLGWEQAAQPSYPRLLAAYSHKDGGKLTLVAQREPPGRSARALAEESRAALQRQGFMQIQLNEETSRVRLDATLDGGRRFVRQLYLVDSGIGYVVTMTGPMSKALNLRRDFDEAAASLTVGPPENPRGGDADAGQP